MQTFKQKLMRRHQLKFYFSIVIDEHSGEYKAMLPVNVMRSQKFYLMDVSGKHEYIPMSLIWSYHYVGHAIAINDANTIRKLLVALNAKDEDVGASSCIHIFNGNQSFRRTMHDRTFLAASRKSVRFTEDGYFY